MNIQPPFRRLGRVAAAAWNTRRVRLVLLVVASLVVACNAEPTGTAPPSPTAGAPTLDGAAPATSTATGGQASPESTAVSPAAVQVIIDAVIDHDTPAFAKLLQPLELTCSTRGAFGELPGNCAGDPKSGIPPLPPDMVVEVYPESSCEFELDETDATALAERFLSIPRELFAVVELDVDVFSVDDDSALRQHAEYGVIWSHQLGRNVGATLLAVEDDRIVFMDAACGGGPEVFLESHPVYGSPTVLVEGPAYAP